MKRLRFCFCAIWLLSAASGWSQSLAVGDPAPELKASRWVKGDPIETLAPDQTYVVEFWATWCPPCRSSIPHLTELAKRFTNATVIGMNIWERGGDIPAKVGSFVEDMGDQMDYAVAIDTDDGHMSTAWMRAAGRNGIPAAFIVHQGRIAWIGHPMSMEAPLAAVLDGSFDFAAPPPATARMAEGGDSLRALVPLLEKYFAAIRQEDKPDDAAELARQIEDLDIQQPGILNHLAWAILTQEGFVHRDLPLATRLARKGVELSKEKDAHILDTLARALWDGGQAEEAIEMQRKAVARAPKDPSFALVLETYLDESRPGGPALRLRTERFGMPVVELNGAIYAPGGHSDRGILGTVERFGADATATETLSERIQPRRYHVAAAHDGKIYIAGGALVDDGGRMLTPSSGRFEEFNPETGETRRLPDLPIAVSRAGAAVVGGRLFVMGGAEASGRRTAAVQIFDFESETWNRGADLPVAREGNIFAHEGTIIAPGGYDGAVALRDVQRYDVKADAWTQRSQLPVKSSAFQGVVADGWLYLFGDYDELDRTVACHIDSDKWHRIEIGYKPARHAGAARLGDAVYVVGGNVQSGPPYLARIQRFSLQELADAPRRKWKPAPTPTPRRPAATIEPRPTRRPAARPDANFFHLKWEQDLEDGFAMPYMGSRIQSGFPPRHLVFASADRLQIRRADNGGLVHTISLPEAVRAPGDDAMGPSQLRCVFVQDGDGGMVVGSRSLYELTDVSSNRRSYRGIGEQFIRLSTDGALLSLEQEDSHSGRSDFNVLPVGPDRDVLLAGSWTGFQIVDARQNLLLDHREGSGERWFFRPAAEGGIEALVIGPRRIACYELRLPGMEPAQPAPPPPASVQTGAEADSPVGATPRPSRIDRYSEMLDRDPNNVNALHWRGFLHAMRGDAKASRRDFEKAIRLAPTAANVRWSYGWALLNLGKFTEAARQWEQMAEIDPAVPGTEDYRLALAYWADGQKDAALKIFNAAVARQPSAWITRDHAARFTSHWTEKEKAILFELHDAWRRIYPPPATAADIPLPNPDLPVSEQRN